MNDGPSIKTNQHQAHFLRLKKYIIQAKIAVDFDY